MNSRKYVITIGVLALFILISSIGMLAFKAISTMWIFNASPSTLILSGAVLILSMMIVFDFARSLIAYCKKENHDSTK